MVNKTCEKCGHIFPTPSQLQTHLKRKTPCDQNNIKNFKCKYCHISFSFSNSMYRHIKNSCNVFKEEEQKKIQEYNDIQMLQLQVLQIQQQLLQGQLLQGQLLQNPQIQNPQNNASITTQNNIENQNIDKQINVENQNIDKQINVNLHLCNYNTPFTDTEDVLKSFLVKDSAAQKYVLIDEKDDLSIEDENDLIAKIIIEINKHINAKKENRNIMSSDKEECVKVYMLTENGKKWCYISLDNSIREISDKTIRLINRSEHILPDKINFKKLPPDLRKSIDETLKRIPETYRDQKDSIRGKTKHDFKIIFDINNTFLN